MIGSLNGGGMGLVVVRVLLNWGKLVLWCKDEVTISYMYAWSCIQYKNCIICTCIKYR